MTKNICDATHWSGGSGAIEEYLFPNTTKQHLKSESFVELDKVVAFMNDNPRLK